MSKKNKTSLSFEVESVKTFLISGCEVYDTTLRSYTTNERITMRGNKWKLGSKVDFKEL